MMRRLLAVALLLFATSAARAEEIELVPELSVDAIKASHFERYGEGGGWPDIGRAFDAFFAAGRWQREPEGALYRAITNMNGSRCEIQITIGVRITDASTGAWVPRILYVTVQGETFYNAMSGRTDMNKIAPDDLIDDVYAAQAK